MRLARYFAVSPKPTHNAILLRDAQAKCFLLTLFRGYDGADREGHTMNHEEFEQAARYWTDKRQSESCMPKEQLKGIIEGFLTSHNTCSLACAAGDFVRCTPLEYSYRDGSFWIFSEGGLKFFALERNRNVSLAVYDSYDGFGKLGSAQISGVADIIDPDDEAFAIAAREKGIQDEALPKIKKALHLIKVVPRQIDFLSSELKSQGFDIRQHIELPPAS